MNIVVLSGRLTRDPEVRYGSTNQTAVARFTIAIDRGKKDGQDLGADFPSIVCFGKTAENVEKYVKKGRLVGIVGKIQTGSYEKDGVKHYTTDVLASRVEFFDSAKNESAPQQALADGPNPFDVPAGFSALDEDIPF